MWTGSAEAEGGPMLMGLLPTRKPAGLASWRTSVHRCRRMAQTFEPSSRHKIAFLDNADGAFEAGQLALIRNSMLSACQNLLRRNPRAWAANRSTPQHA